MQSLYPFVCYGHGVLFNILAIVNFASISTGVHYLFKLVFLVFSNYVPRSGIAGVIEYFYF